MKKVIASILLSIILLSCTAMATSTTRQIEVEYGISVAINGEIFIPKDVNGKEVPLFTNNGTTYAPVRAISNALGAVIGYDQQLNAVTITKPYDFTRAYGMSLHDLKLLREIEDLSDDMLYTSTLSDLDLFDDKTKYYNDTIYFVDYYVERFNRVNNLVPNDATFANAVLVMLQKQLDAFCSKMYYLCEYLRNPSALNEDGYYDSYDIELTYFYAVNDELFELYDYLYSTFPSVLYTDEPNYTPAIMPTRNNPPTNSNSTITPAPSYSFSFPLHLYSYDGKLYLGKLTTNAYDIDSIYNEYGTYGSKYQANSIWNTYGIYGSQYSNTSAFNQYATNPPVIADNNGKLFGYLTANTFMKDGFTFTELDRFLRDNYQ